MALGVAAAVLASVLVGALVALQPPINSELARRTSDLSAAFLSASVTAGLLGLLLLLLGGRSRFEGLGQTPLIYLTGGLCGAVFVGLSLILVRSLGAGAFIALVVAAQLIVSAALDHFGLIGLDQIGLSPIRLLGMAFLIVGAALVALR